jgi:hypothetical protein
MRARDLSPPHRPRDVRLTPSRAGLASCFHLPSNAARPPQRLLRPPTMRPANIQFNLTVDDFDSLITYPNQSHWTTPDPSAAHDPANDIWFDDTYHRTNVTGASFSFGFKGRSFSFNQHNSYSSMLFARRIRILPVRRCGPRIRLVRDRHRRLCGRT